MDAAACFISLERFTQQTKNLNGRITVNLKRDAA
jgi:hypothetical protein